MTNITLQKQHRTLWHFIPGLALSAVITGVALWGGSIPAVAGAGFSALTLAILLGMVLGNTIYPHIWKSCDGGVLFAKQYLLRLGIILYGFRLTFSQIADVGISGIIIDVLTLSATPIPRTLYIALMGARDMSSIETPPVNRQPVQTSVCPYDERIMKKAMERELERGGQIFLLHNRVKTIELFRDRIQALVPKARIVIGHGQMPKEELEKVMRTFVQGKADILLATTIIESGIDIPNANTIIIDRADRFGLADLYQLRGRVGRAGHRAYAYLMLPRSAATTGDARKRVSAIKQYTELGSGFKIAMRDLEIRGAGNLLGTQQSGHIAAIGFDLYCQLLQQSIAQMQGKRTAPRPDAALRTDFIINSETQFAAKSRKDYLGAFLPREYINDAALRISAYKDLAAVRTLKEADNLLRAWEDRFGPAPETVRHLLDSHKIKILASHANISIVEISGQRLMLTRNGDFILLSNKFPRLASAAPADKLRETLDMLKNI